MRLHRPFEAMTPTLDGLVLQVLARAETAFTGRQTAKLIPTASQKGVHNALQRLVEQGIVDREVVGPAHRYSLNRDHLLAPAVVAVARAREAFGERVRGLVATWEVPPEAVILFGSAVRGEMRVDSDVDLFVIGRGDQVWDDQLLELTQQVRRWTGNDARILEMSSQEVQQAAASDPVLREIAAHGQVLYGDGAGFRGLLRDEGPLEVDR